MNVVDLIKEDCRQILSYKQKVMLIWMRANGDWAKITTITDSTCSGARRQKDNHYIDLKEMHLRGIIERRGDRKYGYEYRPTPK